MKNYTILFFAYLFLSCNSKSENVVKIQAQEIKKETNLYLDSIKEVDKPKLIIDTLFFDKNMIGKLLEDKFEYAKPDLKFYKKFVNSKNIDVIQIVSDKHTKTEINYLGVLNDLDSINSYHVITNFRIIGIGQMLSPRGKSEVAFINTKTNKIIIYDLGMPYYLPKKIDKNALFFEFENIKIYTYIFGGLAPLLCIQTIGCN